MIHHEGKTQKEVAEHFGCDPMNIYFHLNKRIRKKGKGRWIASKGVWSGKT